MVYITMRIDIITIFPDMFSGPFATSMIKKARDNGLVEIYIHNLRQWAKDSHKTVDDRPFGGGIGMVLKVEPIYLALKELKRKNTKVILLSPQGKVFNQKKAQKLSKEKNLILIAGHYEGFDERIVEHLVDEEVSIGDYILTGGELAAMVVTDSVVRLLPEVLEEEATLHESFTLPAGKDLSAKMLDYPNYTQPAEFKGWKVPDILLSGNHKEIEKWRMEKALEKTKLIRPDLLDIKR